MIIGLLFWTGTAAKLISMHMLLGLLTVGALWVIGIGQAFANGGSRIIALSAVVLGAVMIAIGLYQSTLMFGEFHWGIQLLHLALGLLTIGMGHMGAARHRKGSVG